jgi:hypothetical protein
MLGVRPVLDDRLREKSYGEGRGDHRLGSVHGSFRRR